MSVNFLKDTFNKACDRVSHSWLGRQAKRATLVLATAFATSCAPALFQTQQTTQHPIYYPPASVPVVVYTPPVAVTFYNTTPLYDTPASYYTGMSWQQNNRFYSSPNRFYNDMWRQQNFYINQHLRELRFQQSMHRYDPVMREHLRQEIFHVNQMRREMDFQRRYGVGMGMGFGGGSLLGSLLFGNTWTGGGMFNPYNPYKYYNGGFGKWFGHHNKPSWNNTFSQPHYQQPQQNQTPRGKATQPISPRRQAVQNNGTQSSETSASPSRRGGNAVNTTPDRSNTPRSVTPRTDRDTPQRSDRSATQTQPSRNNQTTQPQRSGTTRSTEGNGTTRTQRSGTTRTENVGTTQTQQRGTQTQQRSSSPTRSNNSVQPQQQTRPSSVQRQQNNGSGQYRGTTTQRNNVRQTTTPTQRSTPNVQNRGSSSNPRTAPSRNPSQRGRGGN
jgi:hypothetical protein